VPSKSSKPSLPNREELPAVKASSLRSSGAIDAGSAFATVAFGEVKRQVRVTLRRFPSGGSWSLFICPTCSRRAQVVRLYGERVVCRRCDGLKTRAKTLASHPEIDGVVESLQTRLSAARYRRKQLSNSLRKAMIKRRRHALARMAHEL
jgi:hypothetical protein